MRRSLSVVVVLFWLVSVTGCGPEPDTASSGDPSGVDSPVPEGPLPPGVEPESCRLALEILPGEHRFRGRTEISLQVLESLDRFWIHGQELDVSESTLVLPGGERIPAVYRQVHPDGVVRVSLPREIGPGPAVLEIVYSGALSDSLAGLFRIEDGGDAYVFSEFEPNLARRAFPGFDEPRFKIPYQIEVTTRSEYVALSNGAAIGEEKLGEGMKRVRFAATRPLPSYLVAFAVGPLEVVEGPPVPPNDWRTESLPLRGVAPRGKGAGLDYALANTGVMVNALEEYFAQPYPYEKLDLVAVPTYPGAMEYAGLIYYSEDLLLLGASPSFRQIEAFGSTHAHELAHQWLGDLVTMSWWDDLWLNEASADWMAGKIMARWRPDLHYDRSQQAAVYEAMDDDSLQSSRRVREPVSDSAGMFAAFDNLTYVKGAAILGMLESYLGEDTFQEGWRHYLASHLYGNATVFDLIASLEQAAGGDRFVGDIFRSFLFQPGVPEIRATILCGPEEAVITLSQRRYLPLGSEAAAAGPWTIPVCMRWERDGRQDPGGSCLVMSEASSEFPLGQECPAWIMPNRGGAGYYRWSVDPVEYIPVGVAGRSLDDREKMSVADSLAASVHSGDFGAGDYLAAVPELAAALERSVSLAPVPELRQMFDYLIGPADQELARAYLGAIYERRLEFLDRPGGAEADSELKRFRSGIVTFLAQDIRDPALREDLAVRAAAQVGFEADGPAVGAALPPDLVRTALAVGVQDLGPPFFDYLVGRLDQEPSAAVRKDILYAIGSADQPLLLARARNLLLDERVRGDEVAVLLWWLTRAPRTTGTWDWFTGNAPNVMDRIAAGWRWQLPLYFAPMCDRDQGDALEDIFSGYEGTVPGIATALHQARERIAICEAYRARHTGEVRDFYRSLGGVARHTGFAAGGGEG